MNSLQYTSPPKKGWSAPAPIVPVITNLSNYYSPAGVRALIVITGSNFRPFSSVKFATFNPTIYFVSSQQIEFYIPSTLVAGIYTVQVFNDNLASQVVEYTLDGSSGYWFEHNGGTITNTNFGGIALNGETIIDGNLTVTGLITGTIAATEFRDVIQGLVREIKDIKKELKETQAELILYKKQLKEVIPASTIEA
jgi:hypothetical protein